MSDKNFYVLGDDNCKYEGMSKEQIIATIQEAISTGTIPELDAGVITKIKEQNKQRALSFWVGSQAEYNAIQKKADNCFYIINNSGNFAELKQKVDDDSKALQGLTNNFDNYKRETDAGIDQFEKTVNENLQTNQKVVEEIVKKSGAIVEEYHEDKVHYFRFGNGLEIELGEFQKVTAYSNNSYGFKLKKIAEDDLISFNISLSTSQCVRASEDHLIGNIIVVVLMSISQDGTVNDTNTSVGVVYGSYIAFGLSGLGAVKGVN